MIPRRAQSLVRWVVSGVVIVCLAGLAAYLALQYARPVVTVTEAVEGPVVQAFYSTGTVLPAHEYPIKSNIAGILTEVKVDKGDAVRKGQVLAVVSEPELTFKARQAEAELTEKQKLADDKTSPILAEFDARFSATNDMLEIAKRDQKRLTDLMERSAASQTDIDRAMDRVKEHWRDAESIKALKAAKKLELERQVQVAQAALDIARWNLEQQSIKSPIDGVVLDRPTSLGTRVAINDHLMQVADVRPESLVMRAAVDEEDIIKVSVGQTVRMTLYSFAGASFEGKVDRIYDKADPDRRTFEVDVKLVQQEARLAAGMTGELAFIMATKDRATVVPSQALQGGAVYRVVDGHLQRTAVQTGLSSVERVEIRSGLSPGQQVAISPVSGYADGKSVRTSYMDPIAAAGLNKPPPVESAFKAFQ